jgi:hypothetical protein
MRSRFRKVWCEACKSMQFAGECPHGRVVLHVPLPQWRPHMKKTDSDQVRGFFLPGLMPTQARRR